MSCVPKHCAGEPPGRQLARHVQACTACTHAQSRALGLTSMAAIAPSAPSPSAASAAARRACSRCRRACSVLSLVMYLVRMSQDSSAADPRSRARCGPAASSSCAQSTPAGSGSEMGRLDSLWAAGPRAGSVCRHQGQHLTPDGMFLKPAGPTRWELLIKPGSSSHCRCPQPLLLACYLNKAWAATRLHPSRAQRLAPPFCFALNLFSNRSAATGL